MALYHRFDCLTNTKGDSLVGYRIIVRVANAGVPQTLYGDINGTPIVTYSGIANTAVTDDQGNFSYFIQPSGTYDEEYYTPSGVFAFATRNIPMLLGVPGPKGDPGAGGNVAVGRAQLKTGPAANATAGDVWALSEGIRSGNFVRRVGTPPASDPYEGLYVVIDGNNYFERVVTSPYSLGWWDPTSLGNNADLAINSAFAMLSALVTGARINVPDATYLLTNALGISGNGVTLFGSRGAVFQNAPGRPQGSTATLGITGNDVLVEGITIIGQRTDLNGNDNASNAPALIVGAKVINGVEVPTMRVTIRNVAVSASLPFAAAGQSISPTTFAPVDGLRLEGCNFVGDYAICNMPGVQNVYISPTCTFIFDGYHTTNVNTQCVRIYGSQNVVIDGPLMIGAGADTSNQVLVRMSQLNLGSGYSRPNGDVTILNLRGSNFNTAVYVNDCSGTLKMRGGTVGDGILGTKPVIGVVIDTVHAVWNVDIEGVTFNGVYTTPLQIITGGGVQKTLRFNRNTVIGNSCMLGGANMHFNIACDLNSAPIVESLGNRFVMPGSSAVAPGRFVVAVPGSGIWYAWDNVGPETSGAPLFYPVGGGKVQTSQAGPPTAASQNGSTAIGTNCFGVDGVWSALKALG